MIEEADGLDLDGIALIASRENPPSNEESATQREREWASTQWDLHHRKMAIHGELYGVGAQIMADRLVGATKEIPRNPETGEYDNWNK
ncbi:MAG TPA: hypothetical protein VEB69_10995 [Acidimicrobiia bacterium]|nr:hypothetical protein [Acidimicrobiia bacterium]